MYFFLIYVHIVEAFSLSSTSHSKQRLELATFPTDRRVKRVYSNMLTSTKSTGGRGAADVSQEEEEDEGLHSSSQAPPQLSCKHEPSFFTYEKTVKPQWDIRIVTEGFQINFTEWKTRIQNAVVDPIPPDWHWAARPAHTGLEGGFILYKMIFFKSWNTIVQVGRYRGCRGTHSMVSVAGVKLAAKHVQLHNCRAMDKLFWQISPVLVWREMKQLGISPNRPPRPNLTSSL